MGGRMNAVFLLLGELGRAGVEIALDPTDATKIRWRPSAIHAGLTARLRLHKAEILAVLKDGYEPRDDDALDVLTERLGVADDLGMPTHVGSPAWLIAVSEAQAAVETAEVVTIAHSAPRSLSQSEPDGLAAMVASILGVEVWAEVRPLGERFDGEPDWGGNIVTNERTVQLGAAPCRFTHHRRWWRMAGKNGMPTCGSCHAPAPGVDVEWINGNPPTPATTNTADSPPHQPSNHDTRALQSLGLCRPRAERGS